MIGYAEFQDKWQANARLALDTIVLLRSGGLPKTTSGKTQRHACRAGLQLGRLPVVAEWGRRPLAGVGPSATEDRV